MQTRHYGVTVDSEVPITGVFNINEVDYLTEDIDRDGIGVGWEEHIEECDEECHEDCDYGDLFYLLGFKKGDDGLWDEDPKAEYSALVSYETGYAQVTRSKYGIRCNLCSPCYPGQGDVNSEGEYIAYAFPPYLFSADEDYQGKELLARIFEIGKEKENAL